MTLIVNVDLPDLAEAAGVLGVPSTPMALKSSTWRSMPPPQAALRLIDEIGDAWKGEEAVIVVHPPGRLDLRLVLQSLASIVGRDRVVDLPLGRTPLAASYATTFASVLAPELQVPLGLMPEMLRTMEQQVTVSALLAGVSSLETPQPSLRLQVRGYWPSTRFLVHRGRTDRVMPVRRRHSTGALARALAPPSHRLLASVPTGATGWMSATVARRHDGSQTPVALLTSDPWTPKHWGTGRVIEVVGLSSRWRYVVTTLVDQLAERTCSWCAQRVNEIDTCDLCSDEPLRLTAVSRPPPPPRPATKTPASNAPVELPPAFEVPGPPPRSERTSASGSRRAPRAKSQTRGAVPKPGAAEPVGPPVSPTPRTTARAKSAAGTRKTATSEPRPTVRDQATPGAPTAGSSRRRSPQKKD